MPSLAGADTTTTATSAARAAAAACSIIRFSCGCHPRCSPGVIANWSTVTRVPWNGVTSTRIECGTGGQVDQAVRGGLVERRVADHRRAVDPHVDDPAAGQREPVVAAGRRGERAGVAGGPDRVPGDGGRVAGDVQVRHGARGDRRAGQVAARVVGHRQAAAEGAGRDGGQRAGDTQGALGVGDPDAAAGAGGDAGQRGDDRPRRQHGRRPAGGGLRVLAGGVADDRDRPHGARAERQQRAGVLEQHGARSSRSSSTGPRCAGVLTIGVLDRRRVGQRVVEQPDPEHRGEDVRDHRVQRRRGTAPSSTAALSLLLKKDGQSWSMGLGLVSLLTPGISRSSPDRAALTVLCSAPQSDITRPSNRHASRRVSVSSCAVLAGVGAVDPVVGAHDRTDAGVLDGRS